MVVSYLTSSSNHNWHRLHSCNRAVVSYLTSSSNHNHVACANSCVKLYLILLHHQTTTWACRIKERERLYLILLHHQTTTRIGIDCMLECCILSYFIIKPQRKTQVRIKVRSCILSYFIIKPQLNGIVGEIEYVVSYLTSSSNHNSSITNKSITSLYLILLHHQTTTLC